MANSTSVSVFIGDPWMNLSLGDQKSRYSRSAGITAILLTLVKSTWGCSRPAWADDGRRAVGRATCGRSGAGAKACNEAPA